MKSRDKVWIVTTDEDDNCRVYGVFSTEEKAKKYRDKNLPFEGDVEEWIVDLGLEEEGYRGGCAK